MIEFMPFILTPAIFTAGLIGYHIGRIATASPDEAEMLRRIKEIRLKRRIEIEVAAGMDRELRE